MPAGTLPKPILRVLQSSSLHGYAIAQRIHLLSTLRFKKCCSKAGLRLNGNLAVNQCVRVALYGVGNLDPASYATAVGVLIAIVALAALLPARCALRLDLAKTLH